MTNKKQTSLQRVLTTMGHQEPDRVPLFLFPTMHGAKELGLSLKEYFANPEYIVEGQLRLLKKYRHDCVSSFFYGALDVEAWGAKVIYRDDGPVTAGSPIIKKPEQITALQLPDIKNNPSLTKVLIATEKLKAKVGNETPVMGVVISPFSLPIMQMGFEGYLNLIFENRDLFDLLMKLNEAFCVSWANAQIEAGATAIAYIDPASSPTIIQKEVYLETGYKIALRVLSKINGPVATHFASGNCLQIAEQVINTGTQGVGVSTFEDLRDLKTAFKGKVTIIGNLNGIEMINWTPQEAESIVKDAIAKAGSGGGFILSDNHGEIPFQVPDEVLMSICSAVRKWGNYSLDWIK